MAHFALFAVGGFIIYLILEIGFDVKNKILISIFCGILFACVDEFHQLYSLNRGPKLFDVGIDTIGVVSGVIVANISSKICRKIYSKLKKENELYGKF